MRNENLEDDPKTIDWSSLDSKTSQQQVQHPTHHGNPKGPTHPQCHHPSQGSKTLIKPLLKDHALNRHWGLGPLDSHGSIDGFGGLPKLSPRISHQHHGTIGLHRRPMRMWWVFLFKKVRRKLQLLNQRLFWGCLFDFLDFLGFFVACDCCFCVLFLLVCTLFGWRKRRQHPALSKNNLLGRWKSRLQTYLCLWQTHRDGRWLTLQSKTMRVSCNITQQSCNKTPKN